MDYVEQVAEAICNSHCGDIEAWDITYDNGRDHWREVAQAAIDALELTEEIGAALTDDLQMSTHYDDIPSAQQGCKHFNRNSLQTAIVTTRLVSPWRAGDDN